MLKSLASAGIQALLSDPERLYSANQEEQPLPNARGIPVLTVCSTSYSQLPLPDISKVSYATAAKTFQSSMSVPCLLIDVEVAFQVHLKSTAEITGSGQIDTASSWCTQTCSGRPCSRMRPRNFLIQFLDPLCLLLSS